MRFKLNRQVSIIGLAIVLGAAPFAMSGLALAAKAATGSTFNANLLLQGSSNVAEPSIRTDRAAYCSDNSSRLACGSAASLPAALEQTA